MISHRVIKDSFILKVTKTQSNTLKFGDRMIRRVSRQSCARSNIARIVLKQAFYEHWVLFTKRIQFRYNDNGAACMGYMRMGTDVFEGINARQAWSNWRTIPRNLSGNIPTRPLKALDLCCGTGQSTEVLAFYLPEGSELLGLEFNPAFVQAARQKVYRHGSGASVLARFNHQSVLETFRDDSGEPVPASSVDVVNTIGAVGHHFRGPESMQLCAEISRVVRPGGIALIDSGEAGTPRAELVGIMEGFGFKKVRSARSCFVDPYEQICFRKA